MNNDNNNNHSKEYSIGNLTIFHSQINTNVVALRRNTDNHWWCPPCKTFKPDPHLYNISKQ